MVVAVGVRGTGAGPDGAPAGDAHSEDDPSVCSLNTLTTAITTGDLSSGNYLVDGTGVVYDSNFLSVSCSLLHCKSLAYVVSQSSGRQTRGTGMA